MGLFFITTKRSIKMTHHEIVTQLSLTSPSSDVLYEIIMETVISAIVRRMGEEALELTAEEIEMARDEVKSAIDHHLDERDYIGIGLDAWEIVRNL
jgi:hypothetical protein